MVLRQRDNRRHRNLKNKKKVFRLKISDTGYAPNIDYLEYHRLQKFEGSNEVDSRYFSTKSFIAYEKSDGNIFIILGEEEDEQTLFCDYLHKNELNIFMDSINDKNEYYHNICNEICEEESSFQADINVEDIDISFQLVETIDKDEIPADFDNWTEFSIFTDKNGILYYDRREDIPINFDNGEWSSIFITDKDDIIYYGYRDQLVDAIKKKLGLYIKNPDIKKGIQRTIYDSYV
jgi:hypothetical protein